MKASLYARLVLLSALLFPLGVRAQSAAVKLQLPAEPTPNRFGFSYQMGFNINTRFKNLGGTVATLNTQITLDGDPYNYDNGFVYPDYAGVNVGSPITWYWGYDSASQVPGPGLLLMQRSVSLSTASSSPQYDTPTPGGQLTYDRELLRKDSWRAGLEGAFGYTSYNVSDNSPVAGDVAVITDTYTVPGGPILESPGYVGRFYLPGQVINVTPSSSVTALVPNAALISGQRDFSANLYAFKLGPYFELPLSRSVNLVLSAGFATAYVQSTFSYNQTVSIAGLPGSASQTASGNGSHWQFGGYVSGTASVALSDRWAAFAGAQFQTLGQYTQTLNGKEAVMDLSQAIFVNLGISYSF